MHIIEPSFEILSPQLQTPADGLRLLQIIETAGRTCYKSEDRITDDSCLAFVRGLVRRGHESVLEHVNITARVVCDRGVGNELTRHRICSLSQESTRYVSSVNKVKIMVESIEHAIELYESGLSLKKVAELSAGKFTEWDVYKALEESGIPRRPKGNRGLRNQNSFESIDTPEKAYLIGLILADGSMRADAPQISITQKKENSWYIRRMLETVLGGPVSVGNDKDCHQITFSGEKLWVDIKNKGIVSDKTHKMQLSDASKLRSAIPGTLAPDFLRGLLDGDGYIRFFRQRGENSNQGSAQLGFTGQKPTLEFVDSILQNYIGGYATKIAAVSGTEYLHRIIISDKNRVVEMCRLMYCNFLVPYGHPVKTSRVFGELTDLPVRFAECGDPKFEVVVPRLSVPLSPALWNWIEAMDSSEKAYTDLLRLGEPPEIARSVLPLCLKTEIVITANLREWRHIFRLRVANPAAHPQIRQVLGLGLTQFKAVIPIIFDDLGAAL